MKRKRARKPLAKRHDDHALSAVLEKMKGKHRETAERLLKTTMKAPSQVLRKMAGVHIVRGYDLRYGQATKALDCHTLAGWTAFINNAHTLCHLMPSEGDFIVRIPLWMSLKNATDNHVSRIIVERINGRVVI